ncbi:class I SAM-dependent methyltransferase [Microbacterium dauci]|uniref:Class I SAM-dependent methyltransferase n=1 Tax=Microbacterium dauci TaxID=3048008 RepID=A0ABT6ZGQ7_9MICO|nr:class I SAM-dependent methyltransferase [Microbacterium sp. LX3-4]MDJ1115334.1 class I SAM-dependent methyltransferase [Microbacterium sp. LX3-4]
MRVLNAYAGIGGNRHLWPDEWKVTALEIDPRVAAEYARRYPNDTVLVVDAHEYLLAHAHEFDAVWSSPPCPTHSKLAKVVASRYGRELNPDPRLWDEVNHLRALGVPFVVENVHTYYAPLVEPDVVTDRHYYWTNNPPPMLTRVHVIPLSPKTVAGEYAESYGLPPIPAGVVGDARKAMRNAVVPQEGLELAMAAFGVHA